MENPENIYEPYEPSDGSEWFYINLSLFFTLNKPFSAIIIQIIQDPSGWANRLFRTPSEKVQNRSVTVAQVVNMVHFSNLSAFILYFQKVSAKHTTYTTFTSQPYWLSENYTPLTPPRIHHLHHIPS